MDFADKLDMMDDDSDIEGFPLEEEEPHKLDCSSCQCFIDEDCETYYDCSACYECAALGGVWRPRHGGERSYETD